MNITDMTRDVQANIISFNNLESGFTKRLMDLGIYESARVTLLNKLSFGNLFLIEVDDIEICLRKEDAMKIEVQLWFIY